MPELPEVENVLLSLQSKVKDQEIISCDTYFENLSPNAAKKMFGNHSSEEIKSKLINQTISNIERHGKFLICTLTKNNQKQKVVVHLGMTGALMAAQDINDLPQNYKNPKHLHIKLKLNNNLYLTFSDIRRFGKFIILKEEEVSSLLGKIGPDVFGLCAKEKFIKNINSLKNKTKNIKQVIMNQEILAGVGNIYACESLFLSNINPLLSISKLNDVQLELLFDNIKSLMEKSISMGGSSISDYVNGSGEVGKFQNEFFVYGKHHCKICSNLLEKIKIDRTTYFCPICQKK